MTSLTKILDLQNRPFFRSLEPNQIRKDIIYSVIKYLEEVKQTLCQNCPVKDICSNKTIHREDVINIIIQNLHGEIKNEF